MATKSLVSTISIFLIIFTSVLGIAQVDSEIISPIRFPIRLSGTFCELRSNHFHSGIDIKSERGTWGDSIFSVDGGHISRINISAGGYGRALYIEHPSGLTTVYAHLQSFTKEVNQYVYQNQIKAESFGVNIELGPNEFPVTKGQFIAKMGSTGYSFGPHLHFEMRQTESNEYINPLRYDLGFKDDVPAIIKQLVIYELDKHLFSTGTKIHDAPQLNGDTIEIDAWRIGIGVRSFDPHNVTNLNGIYSAKIFVDDEQTFEFKFDSIDQNVAEYYNAHIDYGLMKKKSLSVHRCYLAPKHLPSSYRKANDQGVIKLFRDKIQKIAIEVFDYSGNPTRVQFFARRKEQMKDPIYPTYQKQILVGVADTLIAKNVEVFWPKNALFSNLYCHFGHYEQINTASYSPHFQVHADTEPLREEITISIRPNAVPSRLKDKIQMVSLGAKEGEYTNHGGHWSGDWFTTKSGKLGTFTIKADTIAPTISVVRNTATTLGRIFEFRIKDDLPRGPLPFDVTLDGKWILAEYDLKRDTIICKIDKQGWSKGPHHFKLLVRDAVSNASTYENRFTFK